MGCLGDLMTIIRECNLSKLWELVMNREPWHAAAHGVSRAGYD